MACRPVRHHAGSRAFFLRSEALSDHPTEALDGILARGRDATLPNSFDKPIWQKDFFDRQLRSGESYRQKWIYELENPVKAGLAKRWEDWAYQGELNVLSWHEPT